MGKLHRADALNPLTLTAPPCEAQATSQSRRSLFYGSLFFAFWLACSAIFVASEREHDWSFGVAIYFSFVTFTTIGFGDFVITYSETGRGLVLFTLLTLLGLIIFAKALSEFASWLQAALSFVEEEVKEVVHDAVEAIGHTKADGEGDRAPVPSAADSVRQADVHVCM